MGRFLLCFSYIGTRYCGLQRQHGVLNPRTGRKSDRVKTVIGTIEDALLGFRPKDVRVVTSSRTDSGVHALCNTAHVDLIPSSSRAFSEYDPEFLCIAMNKRFSKTNEPIRMVEIRRVADNFHARFLAKNRKYCYRLALYDDDAFDSNTIPLSAFDRERVCVVSNRVDMKKVKEGAKFLSGTTNYLSFTSQRYFKDYIDPVKTLNIEIKPGNLWMEDFNYFARDKFKCYDLIFTGNSFMYRMVRKLMTCLLNIGRGHLTLERVQEILDNPETSWDDHHIRPSPSYALYLLNVEYDKKDLLYSPECPRLYLSQVEKQYHNAIFGLSKTLEAYGDQNSNSKKGRPCADMDAMKRQHIDEEYKDLYAARYLDYLNKGKSR
ncbi:tRNA pseudouridine synthase-like 1 [Lineus longissimus]|uniref:tRNA pseudouridine synthase-like 1 n=1 Tax=Lineus longissimus TaxID=88925 RepID=UPI002B4D6EC6